MLDFNYIEIDDLDLDLSKTNGWINELVRLENKILGDVSYIFCSDEYLLEMNKEHLNHDYYTDIITFDYCEGDEISGDLFISVDRVRENAQLENVEFLNELHRVMAHGVLHLCGYGDKSSAEELLMRKKEDEALALCFT